MNTWILQGNPKRFDVDTYLSRQDDILWTVGESNIRGKIEAGDSAYIWRSDGGKLGSGGIVASCEITAPPTLMVDDALELWSDRAKNDSAWRVRAKIFDRRFTPEDGMVTRTELESHPVLSGLWILKWRSSTVYLVSLEHSQLLEARWKSGKR